jgi:hypothetical protein
MRPVELPTFAKAIEQCKYLLQYRSKLVHSARWQGADIASRPEMATHEVTHISFAVNMGEMKVPSTCVGATLGTLQEDIQPNLPWADDHFEERVCGYPINPGLEWMNWPYGASAATFLDDRGKFNHNYMERYWPKQAGYVYSPTTTGPAFKNLIDQADGQIDLPPRRGIMYEYGDLNDVVELLAGDPYTRQAYLPVWFPEDTGGGSKRAPCTIGYHFLMRDGRLDLNYHIRSCDFVRHFRDDLYLTARLLLWVLDRCRERDDRWNDVRPGKFLMQIGSLHVFRNDYQILMKDTTR